MNLKAVCSPVTWQWKSLLEILYPLSDAIHVFSSYFLCHGQTLNLNFFCAISNGNPFSGNRGGRCATSATTRALKYPTILLLPFW